MSAGGLAVSVNHRRKAHLSDVTPDTITFEIQPGNSFWHFKAKPHTEFRKATVAPAKNKHNVLRQATLLAKRLADAVAEQ